MPGLNFSGANLATVAYAEVLADGSSPNQNSGVTTTRTALGVYVVILPTNLGQVESSDLIYVTLKGNSDGTGITAKNVVVDDRLSITKTINVFAGNAAFGTTLVSTAIDSAFNILILRSTLTPPTNAPY